MIILWEITSGNNVFPYDVRSSVWWLLNRSDRIANSKDNGNRQWNQTLWIGRWGITRSRNRPVVASRVA